MKMYTKPEIEISVFATEDIITASGDINTTGLSDGGTTPNSTTDAVTYNQLNIS